ncbi:MAG: 3-phosphoserine/phosphohydroxythreonine transaminase [Sumerlaeia bacterium]
MTTTAVHRKVNFSAGPAVLPESVLNEAKENILSYGGTGIGVMEQSHRGKSFVAILEKAESDLREILGLDAQWDVTFLSGGATTQFYQIPMNFMKGGTANYHDTGVWSAKAIKEAKAFGTVHVASSSKNENYTHIPKTFTYAEHGVYTHFTSNNTIYGTQYRTEPDSPVPLVCDASSDILSRPVDLAKYAAIYGGAQKNIGPAGVTIMVMRKSWTEAGADNIPSMLQYRNHAANQSCFNTPPCFPIYVASLVFQWIKDQGGLVKIDQYNQEKAAILYNFLDSSDYWTTPVAKEDRSLMNVVFRLPSEELDAKLIKDAAAEGYDGLKGHRSAGGLRASIYNAMTKENVQALVDFMKDWHAKNA